MSIRSNNGRTFGVQWRCPKTKELTITHIHSTSMQKAREAIAEANGVNINRVLMDEVR